MNVGDTDSVMESEHIETQTAPSKGMKEVPQMESYDEALEWYEENMDQTYAIQIRRAISGGAQEELGRSMIESTTVDTLLEEERISIAEDLIAQYYEEAQEVNV